MHETSDDYASKYACPQARPHTSTAKLAAQHTRRNTRPLCGRDGGLCDVRATASKTKLFPTAATRKMPSFEERLMELDVLAYLPVYSRIEENETGAAVPKERKSVSRPFAATVSCSARSPRLAESTTGYSQKTNEAPALHRDCGTSAFAPSAFSSALRDGARSSPPPTRHPSHVTPHESDNTAAVVVSSGQRSLLEWMDQCVFDAAPLHRGAIPCCSVREKAGHSNPSTSTHPPTLRTAVVRASRRKET